jgi:hypothetical protein
MQIVEEEFKSINFTATWVLYNGISWRWLTPKVFGNTGHAWANGAWIRMSSWMRWRRLWESNSTGGYWRWTKESWCLKCEGTWWSPRRLSDGWRGMRFLKAYYML